MAINKLKPILCALYFIVVNGAVIPGDRLSGNSTDFDVHANASEFSSNDGSLSDILQTAKDYIGTFTSEISTTNKRSENILNKEPTMLDTEELIKGTEEDGDLSSEIVAQSYSTTLSLGIEIESESNALRFLEGSNLSTKGATIQNFISDLNTLTFNDFDNSTNAVEFSTNMSATSMLTTLEDTLDYVATNISTENLFTSISLVSAESLITDSNDKNMFQSKKMEEPSPKNFSDVMHDIDSLESETFTSNISDLIEGETGISIRMNLNIFNESTSEAQEQFNEINFTDSYVESISQDSNLNTNIKSMIEETQCPASGGCFLWFLFREKCSMNGDCPGSQLCCKIRCLKTCIDL